MPVRQLPPELAAIAKKELNENPSRIETDIANIKDWISKQPHLKARTDDQWLVALLRGCKYSLERIKKKLDLFYTLRNTASDITRRFSPTEDRFLEILKLGACVILPKAKDVTKPRVILIRPGVYDTEKYHVVDILCVFYYLVQILVNEDDTSTVVGTKILIDYSGITMGHIGQSTPALLKKMIVLIQDSLPLRLKGSHHLHLPSSVEAIINMAKTLVSEKARQRLKIHKSDDDLLNFFAKESIPSEYGGTAGSVAEISDYWAKKVIEYKEWMRQEEKFGTDESKRIGEPVTSDKMFGIEGSFRKLDLD